MGFPKSNKKPQQPKKTTVTSKTTVTMPNDFGGTMEVPPEVADAMEAPADKSVSVSGPPAEADNAVTMRLSDLDALIAARVADALAKAPATPAPAGSLAKEVAEAVAMVMSAAQTNKDNMAHQERLAMLKLKEAKTQKCAACKQAQIACGGVWVKKSDIASLPALDPRIERYTAAKVDRDGFLLEGNGPRRIEDPAINHVRMGVFPRNEENAEWFQGLRINGTLYLSNGQGHEIWVPRVNDFTSTLADFENGEKRTRTQRKFIRQDGGVARPGGTQPMAYSH